MILRLHFMPVHGTYYEKKTEKLPKGESLHCARTARYF